jgi:lipopolysaccharide biosynthesis glycosyltransferase
VRNSATTHRCRTPAAGDPIELAFAIDRQVQAHLPVVLESILEHASHPLRVHVLARELESGFESSLAQDFCHALDLVFYRCDSVRYGDDVRMLPHTTVSTLDRLLLPDILADLDRVLYLDVDLVVRGDLLELWHTDLRGQRLAAKSSSSPNACFVRQMAEHALARLPKELAASAQRHLDRAFDLDCRAFNAGVLLLNLARMREEDFARRFLPLVEHFGMNDQDVLNLYAGTERVVLDRKWNAIPRQDLTEGAVIVHFAGPVKPWSELYISRACDFWACAARYRARTGRLAG